MPDVAADSDEGVLAAWLVEESARFDAAQTIAYVETQDELFSVEAGRPGVLVKTLVEPGTPVESGTPIGILSEPWEQVQDLEAVLADLGVVRRERVAAASLFDSTVSSHRADPAPDPLTSPGPLPVVAEARPAEDEGSSAVEAAPPVQEGRRVLSVDQGRAAALAEDGTTAAPDEETAAPQVEQGRAVPPVEEGTAAAPVGEGALAPVSEPADPEPQHSYLRARVRVDRLTALSARLERDRPDLDVVDVVGRAVAAAHRQVPQLGVARLEDDASASPGIPVTHPGRFGVEEAAAVVPRGQVAALAVGDVRDEPVIEAGAVVPGKVMVLTLSVRPGRVDDAVASRWLAVLVALLERPEWMVD